MSEYVDFDLDVQGVYVVTNSSQRMQPTSLAIYCEGDTEKECC